MGPRSYGQGVSLQTAYRWLNYLSRKRETKTLGPSRPARQESSRTPTKSAQCQPAIQRTDKAGRQDPLF